jgi:enoyl-CoA hydratase/carnithine racemase
MANYARLAQALGAARLKDVIFRARPILADEALDCGFASVLADDPEAEVERLCGTLADHSPTTLWVTKEALRRARHVPAGDDLVLEAYGSEGFRTNVARLLKRY